MREAVIGGAGIAVVPVWLFTDEIDRGFVYIIVERFEPSRLPIHAVGPSRRLLAAKVRAMIDFFSAEFAEVRKLSIVDRPLIASAPW